MTTTPAKKHSVSRRGLIASSWKRKAIRRRGLRAYRFWQHLTRCYGFFRRKISTYVCSWFRKTRAAFGAAALALGLPTLAQAANFQVTSNSDISDAGDGVTTLREAIILANGSAGSDTIDFAGALSGQVIVLTQGALTISDDLSINASSLAQAPVIDANQKSRVMHFTPWEGNLALTNLTLRNGKSSGGGGGIRFASSGNLSLTESTVENNTCSGYYGSGGGISSVYGSVALTNSTVSGNYSRRRGGGIFSYYGDVSLTNSTVSGNSTEDSGGGIGSVHGAVTVTDSTISGNNADGLGGGIHSLDGDVTLTNSTLSGNSAYDGGGIQSFSGAIVLANSTVSGNYAEDDGGGIRSNSAVSLTNSTLSGNAAYSDGGGIYSYGGSVTLSNSTVSGNYAEDDGGGISSYDSSVHLTNSIIAGNSAGDDGPDLVAPEDPGDDLEVSYCLIGDSSGAGLGDAKINLNNLVNVDPLLAPLADNGGPTKTHALGIGSPAIDQGNATGPDQRGFSRVDNPYVPNAVGGNGSDIGAFEGRLSIVVSNGSDVTDGDYSAGNLTLREAISLANGNPEIDEIGFSSTLAGGVITLTQGELVISENLTIDASNLAPAPVIDAGHASRVMHFTAAAGNLQLTKLTIRNGNTTGDGGGINFASNGTLSLRNCTLTGNAASGSHGGGIFSADGAVSLTNSTVSGNSAAGSGGGIHSANGAVTLAASTISGNSTTGSLGGGGGVSSGSGAISLVNSTVSGNSTAGESGGGISSISGIITLTDSTLSGNTASGGTSKGGGIFCGLGSITLTDSVLNNNSGASGGGIASSGAAVSLANSTLSGNSAIGNSGVGGGIASESGNISVTGSTLSGNFTTGNSGDGGGIHSNTGSITLSLSTLSGNSTSGAGSDGGGIQSNAGNIILTSSTLAGNSATGTGSNGGGIHASSGALILTNSIIAGNTDNGTAPDVRAPNAPATNLEASYCIIGTGTGARLGEAKINLNNLVNVDPLLGPLADNGGVTKTHSLAIGSPAIDKGNATGADQRGFPRIDSPGIPNAAGGNGADIGAFERPGGVVVSEGGDVTDGDVSEGHLSLREAIVLANGNPAIGEVTFRNQLSGAVIVLAQGELVISEELSIDASSLAQAPVIDAGRNSRLMRFNAPVGDLKLTKLTLRNGRTTGGYDGGGGINFGSNGTLSLTDSILSGNSSGGYYGNGGGIFTRFGDIRLTNSTLSGNSTSGEYGNGGGIYTRSGDVTLTDSILSGNSAGGDYGDGGGIWTNSGAVSLTHSTLSDNSASDDGGGIRVSSGAITLTDSTLSGNDSGDVGGGIFSSAGAISLTNSTLSGNSASDDGGGIWSSYGATTLTNSTLSGNSASDDGGGIWSYYGSVSLTNSIIAGNTAAYGYAPDLLSPDSPGNNLAVSHCLIGDSAGARLGEAKVNLNNLADIDPRLGPLADNGGDTETMLPIPGSPVINAGLTNGLTKDQRGFDRIGATDIGAVEYQGASDLSLVFGTDSDGDGNSFGIEQALGTDPNVSDPGNPRNLTAPTFNSSGQPVLAFGIANNAAPGTRWILERSTNLAVFQEIYRFDGTTHFDFEGIPINIQVTATGVIITDQAPPTGAAFYRFKTYLASP